MSTVTKGLMEGMNIPEVVELRGTVDKNRDEFLELTAELAEINKMALVDITEVVNDNFNKIDIRLKNQSRHITMLTITMFLMTAALLIMVFV